MVEGVLGIQNEHQELFCCKGVTPPCLVHALSGMQSSTDPSSHKAGDFKALLGRLLLPRVTVSSLCLVDAAEKLIMHLQALVKEPALGREGTSPLMGPRNLESQVVPAIYSLLFSIHI